MMEMEKKVEAEPGVMRGGGGHHHCNDSGGGAVG
jgi:hypothetical protein